MKAFLEEYGLVIVVIIVIAVLIALAVYFSKDGKSKIEETYDTFTEGAQSVVEESMKEVGELKVNGGNAGGGGGTP